MACARQYNIDHLGEHFSDRDLWLMVTRNASIAMGADGQLGRLREGFVADIAVFAKDGADLHTAVVDADIDDVVLVMRGGQTLTGDADIVAGMLPAADYATCEALTDCLAGHDVCVDGGLTLASILTSAGDDAYPLYICDAPGDEPTCEPLRDNEDNDGIIYPTSAPDDLDLDGVLDADDNCPSVFNPPRPLELWMQADEDLDGVGDACDVCPTDERDTCNWLDSDLDGYARLDDNCPEVANPDQADSDGDLLGDLCDDCPNYASASGACPESIYDVKQGKLNNEALALEHMVVTAIAPSGFFMQLDPAESSYTGPDYSGIYVYAPSLSPVPNVGDKIAIEGIASDFYGQLQLGDIAAWTLEAAGTPLPAPIVAPAADVSSSGARQDALEALLVTVEDVEILAVDVAPGPGDSSPTNEVEVTGGLVVNDLFYDVVPPFAIGERFASITGVLRWANDKSKLEPRDGADILAEAGVLDALIPTDVFLEAGTTTDALLSVSIVRPAATATLVMLECAPQDGAHVSSHGHGSRRA